MMKLFFRLAVIVGALPVTLTNGTTADATQVMSDLNWIVNQVNANAAPLATTALTNVNNNFTAVQSGIAATAAANFPIASQIQQDVFRTLQSTLGTNTLTARCAALALSAYSTDEIFTFFPAQPNTGPANINIDAVGSTIIFSMGSTLVGGEMRAGVAAQIKKDANTMNLMNPANVRFDLGSVTANSNARVIVNYTRESIALGRQPFRTVYLSGLATHTIQTGCTRLALRMVGAGGGGGASANGGGSTGSTGGNSVFGNGAYGNIVAGGGSGGTGGSSGSLGGGGAGGTVSGAPAQVGLAGGRGQGATAGGTPADGAGGAGGNTAFGGAGAGSTSNGNAGATNTGSGGQGGGSSGGSVFFASGGGGAGAFVETVINNPDKAWSYSVGTAGAGASSSNTGGNGGSGIIIIEEFFN